MIAAPFLGEFGWEVALWVPWLRWMRRNLYAGQDFVALCKGGHEFLYDDFATTYPITPVNVRKADCQNVWVEAHGKYRKEDYVGLVREHGYKSPKAHIITPLDLQVNWPPLDCPRPTKRTEPLAYFEGAVHLDDHVALHIRRCQQSPERNWHHSEAEEVVNQLDKLGYKVHCVGSGNDSDTIDGATDLRGVSLQQLCATLSNCSVIVGPSSGPLHLANFCGTPAVWWSGNEKDLTRYSTHWNPFELPNRTTHKPTWNPNPDHVLDVLAVHFHKQGLAK